MGEEVDDARLRVVAHIVQRIFDSNPMTVGQRRALPFAFLASLLALDGCGTPAASDFVQYSSITWNGQSRIEVPLTLNEVGLPTIPVQLMGKNLVALIDTGNNGGSRIEAPALAPLDKVQFGGHLYSNVPAGPLPPERCRRRL